MSNASSEAIALTAEERDRMHALYRQGGRERLAAPHIVYPEVSCPHDDCDQPMQAIDFRLADQGRAVHDPLVRAWWDDTGFAGRCPRCGGRIHFTIRGKRAITPEEAADYPQLPDDWHARATIFEPRRMVGRRPPTPSRGSARRHRASCPVRPISRR